jgi:lipopolysaccharide/colanic/teichoic acid biosynthesis glycosyltransferase
MEHITEQITFEKWSSLPEVLTSTNDSQLYFAYKRCLDVTIAVMALIGLLPLLLVVALLIKLDSPGPVFFRQERIGSKRRTKDGHNSWEVQKFKIYKFRSMVNNADDSVHRAYIKAFVEGSAEERTDSTARFKLGRDPRLTRIGHFLRKTSIDELPQLINVLAGDMSLVGPRPVPEYEVAEYREAWHYGRLATTPGITGYWQVMGRGQVSFEEMVRLDLEYIRRQSLWLDLKILWLTVPTVLSGRGAE